MTVELEPLTVLIGPNDSGKSSLLEAMYRLGQTGQVDLVAGPDRRAVFVGDVLPWIWRQEPGRHLTWETEVEGDGRSAQYRLALGGAPGALRVEEEQLRAEGFDFVDYRADPKHQGVDRTNLRAPRFSPNPPSDPWAMLGWFRGEILTTERYRLEPDFLRLESELRPGPVLDAHGMNLPGVIDAIMTGPNREAILSVEAALKSAFPSLERLALETTEGPRTIDDGGIVRGGPPTRALRLMHRVGGGALVPIPAEQASDGVLLWTAYLALAYSDTPSIILIEEPENGLHPGALKRVIDVLRKISRGEVGNRPRQIVMTTHSPLLLNHVEPSEVRIVQRDPEQGTRVSPLASAPKLPELLREFSVGELWFLLGEEGLLRGESP